MVGYILALKATSQRICRREAICRLYATDAKALSKTLLLPRTSFPLWTDPEITEVPYRRRTCDDLYKWQYENASGPLFIFHDGPPYANGDLHMGHALNKILKDIMNRYQVLMGRKVHYIPGWDCHGLPIENKALQEMGQDSLTASPVEIRIAAYKTAIREVGSQMEQFRQFGIMADWDNPHATYRTLDHDYEMRQLKLFRIMVEKGLIYRHYRPVHYSPSSYSALAEAELIYKEDHVSHSVYVTFAAVPPSVNHVLATALTGAQLAVWTTTPWTLTANMGIAVHPEMIYTVIQREKGAPLIVAKDRLESLTDILGPVKTGIEFVGEDLIGITYFPIFSALNPTLHPLPIIMSQHVTPDSGTGLVHCAPAHGAEDYNVFQSLGLLSQQSNPMLCHVDREGKFSEDVKAIVGDAGDELIGQAVLQEGSRNVVKILGEMGSLITTKRIKHKYPYDWKTNEPIIVTATSQWFANLDNIKELAINALAPVEFIPPQSRNRLEAFVNSRSEWCISRQRVWGVPIPALYHSPSDRAVLDSRSLEHILSILDSKGIMYWWDGDVEEFIPEGLLKETESTAADWKKGTDTMDVWFDSGTSWSMLPGGRTFRADMCLEGSDQHRGWFQSQLLTAVASQSNPASPYGTLVTHGMVLDEKGKKMSKSLGNVTSPLTVVSGGKNLKKEPAYGADMLRLWAATVEYSKDTSMGPKVLAQTSEAMKRIRNTVRFLLGNLGDSFTSDRISRVPQSELGLIERYVLHELYHLEQTALEGYFKFNFQRVMSSLVNFANITLSSLYFDITKDCLYADSIHSIERRKVLTVLEQLLKTTMTIVAPVLPHLAEEIQQNYRLTEISMFRTPWKPMSSQWDDPQAAKDMEILLTIRKTVLSLLEEARGDKRVKSSLEAEVDLFLGSVSEGHQEVEGLLLREESFLKTLFIVSDAVLTDEGALGVVSPSWVYVNSVEIPGTEINIGVRVRPALLEKCPRCWTFTRHEDEELCSRCAAVVS